uniref:Uncharacterized protein n=1 Tax=Timema tahoe TaxID=61484 RepID=A0A7R9ISC0_9NEOP|nr:unnamed protein product [Timema tahoe]
MKIKCCMVKLTLHLIPQSLLRHLRAPLCQQKLRKLFLGASTLLHTPPLIVHHYVRRRVVRPIPTTPPPRSDTWLRGIEVAGPQLRSPVL